MHNLGLEVGRAIALSAWPDASPGVLGQQMHETLRVCAMHAKHT